MIDGGGKIGGGPSRPTGLAPPTATPPPTAAKPEPAPKSADGKPAAARPSDSFEKAAQRPSAKAAESLAAEHSGSSDLLALARASPAAARQLLATIAAQAQKNAAKLDQELAGARATLEQLAAQRFAKKALDEKKKSLRQKRDRIASLKTRINLGERQMALLQQLAGKLADPQLAEDLGRFLGDHAKLQTDWGRRHHLLCLAQAFYGVDEETPEHLREVVRADVRPGPLAEVVGDAIPEVSPRRVIAELIARTLDGSVRERGDTGEVRVKPVPGVRGEHGNALQSWATLGETMAAALGRDPFKRGDPFRRRRS